MKVYLTFDVEVWCDGWDDLDRKFPAAFDRYCYGRSVAGDYALPKTLEILNANGLRGVFFVEPLFSARFGPQWLQTLVDLIQGAGQDVQLHLHPEWTDEITPPILPGMTAKRQHLSYYSEAEQTTLIGAGRGLLEAAKGGPVNAFRAGSYAVNRDTYRALRTNGLHLDSSLNACYDYSEGTIDGLHEFHGHQTIDDVDVFPVTVFRDGIGRMRPAQINGCSFAELRAALLSAEHAGVGHFVIVSHNFEMLKFGRSEPDRFVVERFEKLCAFLGTERDRFDVGSFEPVAQTLSPGDTTQSRPAVGAAATVRRLIEQACRRF